MKVAKVGTMPMRCVAAAIRVAVIAGSCRGTASAVLQVDLARAAIAFADIAAVLDQDVVEAGAFQRRAPCRRTGPAPSSRGRSRRSRARPRPGPRSPGGTSRDGKAWACIRSGAGMREASMPHAKACGCRASRGAAAAGHQHAGAPQRRDRVASHAAGPPGLQCPLPAAPGTSRSSSASSTARRKRLRQVAVHTGGTAGHHGLRHGVAGQRDHRHPRPPAPPARGSPRVACEAVHARHVDIHQHHIRQRAALQRGDGGDAVRRLVDAHGLPGAAGRGPPPGSTGASSTTSSRSGRGAGPAPGPAGGGAPARRCRRGGRRAGAGWR